MYREKLFLELDKVRLDIVMYVDLFVGKIEIRYMSRELYRGTDTVEK